MSDSLTAERDRLQHALDDAIDEIASLKRNRDMLLSDRSKLELRVARLEHEARGAAEASEADRMVRDAAHVMLGKISGIVKPGDGELLVPAVRRLRDENDRLRLALAERALEAEP